MGGIVKNDHRQWLYHKEQGGRLFEKDEEIPEGWYDSPAFNDPRTKRMWDGGQAWVEPVIEVKEPEPAPKRYPSQMNKTELLEHGKLLGIELDAGMTVREMREAINAKVEAANEEGEHSQE